MAEEVKLLGMWASPFTRIVELALKLKGVQYEYIEEDLHNKSALLLKYNPIHKKIPVLVHNGKPISESLLILEYIDETWQKTPLFPKDPYNRAMARFWARFVDDQEILWIALKGSAAKDVKEQMQAIEEICQRLEWLDSELKAKDFYGGEAIGYLDIAVFFIIYWIYMRQDFMIEKFITEEKFPDLYEWFQSFLIWIWLRDVCLQERNMFLILWNLFKPPSLLPNNISLFYSLCFLNGYLLIFAMYEYEHLLRL